MPSGFGHCEMQLQPRIVGDHATRFLAQLFLGAMKASKFLGDDISGHFRRAAIICDLLRRTTSSGTL
jgi:hypothetical protein